jgi:hypothetical protein
MIRFLRGSIIENSVLLINLVENSKDEGAENFTDQNLT